MPNGSDKTNISYNTNLSDNNIYKTLNNSNKETERPNIPIVEILSNVAPKSCNDVFEVPDKENLMETDCATTQAETGSKQNEIEFISQLKEVVKSMPKPTKKNLPVKAKKLQSYYCPVCKIIMFDAVTWRTHLKKVHPTQKIVSNIEQLDMLEEMKKNKDKYLKDEKAYKKRLLKLLIFDNNDSFVTCSICKSIFSAKQKAIGHVELAHLNIKQYPCQFCEKVFGDESTHSSHKSRFHLREMKVKTKKTTTAVIDTVDILE